MLLSTIALLENLTTIFLSKHKNLDICVNIDLIYYAIHKCTYKLEPGLFVDTADGYWVH